MSLYTNKVASILFFRLSMSYDSNHERYHSSYNASTAVLALPVNVTWYPPPPSIFVYTCKRQDEGTAVLSAPAGQVGGGGAACHQEMETVPSGGGRGTACYCIPICLHELLSYFVAAALQELAVRTGKKTMCS